MKRVAMLLTLTALAVQLGGCGNEERVISRHELVPLSGTIAVEGAKLEYRIQGSGPTCLVIGSSIYYPRTFSDDLRERLRLVFVDLRHFAPTDADHEADLITLDTYAEDVEQVRRKLELGRVCVIGHSIHGSIALEYARRYPEQVERVVAIGSPPVGLVRVMEAGSAYWEADASAERKAAVASNWEARGAEIQAMAPEKAFVASYVADGPRYWAAINYDSTLLWDDVFINVEVSNHVFGAMFSEYDLGGDPSIAVPVLIVMGRHDYVVPHTLWDGQRGKLPDHEFVLLNNSGHTPQLEDPEAFNDKLLAFLGVE